AFRATCDDGAIAPGVVLWRAQIASPVAVPMLDNGPPGSPLPGIALGILSTPLLDLSSTPPRLYVVAQDKDAAHYGAVWKAFALDATSGATLPGWPVILAREAIEPRNK